MIAFNQRAARVLIGLSVQRVELSRVAVVGLALTIPHPAVLTFTVIRRIHKVSIGRGATVVKGHVKHVHVANCNPDSARCRHNQWTGHLLHSPAAPDCHHRRVRTRAPSSIFEPESDQSWQIASPLCPPPKLSKTCERVVLAQYLPGSANSMRSLAARYTSPMDCRIQLLQVAWREGKSRRSGVRQEQGRRRSRTCYTTIPGPGPSDEIPACRPQQEP